MTAGSPMVFVVDDDRSVRDGLWRLVTSVGLAVEIFPSAQAFLSARRPDAPGCLVLDVRLPGLSGLDLERNLGDTDTARPARDCAASRPLRAPPADRPSQTAGRSE